QIAQSRMKMQLDTAGYFLIRKKRLEKQALAPGTKSAGRRVPGTGPSPGNVHNSNTEGTGASALPLRERYLSTHSVSPFPCIPISSMSNTSTEFGGISGLGLMGP